LRSPRAIGEFHTENQFWQLVVAVRRRQFFCAASTSLKTMANVVRFDRQPFDRIVLLAHGCELAA
jgi:hypothetical protein